MVQCYYQCFGTTADAIVATSMEPHKEYDMTTTRTNNSNTCRLCCLKSSSDAQLRAPRKFHNYYALRKCIAIGLTLEAAALRIHSIISLSWCHLRPHGTY